MWPYLALVSLLAAPTACFSAIPCSVESSYLEHMYRDLFFGSIPAARAPRVM